MRILIIVQNYPPERGPVRYSHDLATAMSQRGHDVTILTGLPHYPFGVPYEGFGRFRPIVQEEDGVRVIRIPLVMGSNQQRLRRIVGFLSFAMSSLPWIATISRPDVIIASVPPLTVAPLGLVARGLRRTPLVMMLRDIEPLISMQLCDVRQKFFARRLVRLTMQMYRRADSIVVIHDRQADILKEHGIPQDKIETITHGIDVPRFLQQMDTAVPFELPRRQGRRVALYLGTIGVVHDLLSLVEAFSTPLLGQVPLDLILIGDGEQAPECRRLIEQRGLDNVKILAPVPLQWVPAVLAQADLLVCSFKTLPTPVPGMGCKVYEYLASGKPFLVHGDGVAAEVVRAIGNGWVCQSDDTRSLAESISMFLANCDAAVRMGLQGREFVAKNHDASQNYDHWEELLYRQVRKT